MNVEGFLQSLPIMLYGMAGIFAVILIVYLATLIIAHAHKRAKKKPAGGEVS